MIYWGTAEKGEVNLVCVCSERMSSYILGDGINAQGRSLEKRDISPIASANLLKRAEDRLLKRGYLSLR